MENQWNLNNLPPEGHEDVGPFVWQLFETAKAERDRLEMPDRWLAHYKLYRGDHWQSVNSQKNKNKISLNFFFANVQRTVANITSRNPEAEVISMDGQLPDEPPDDQDTLEGANQLQPAQKPVDDADKVLTAKLKKWWKDTKQRQKLRRSALNMELYGLSIEKKLWDKSINAPNTVLVDPFAFFPAPGYYEDMAMDCPYVTHAYPMTVDAIESRWNLPPDLVQVDDTYSLLGGEREELRPKPTSHSTSDANPYGRGSGVQQSSTETTETYWQRGLVAEVWVRDNRTETEFELLETDPTHEVDVYIEKEVPIYPGGIRVILVTNNGDLVLDDVPNPNINLDLPRDQVEKCYLYDHLPFDIANSYVDTTSIWGFGAAEQTAKLNYKIDEIISRLVAYVNRSLYPTLIIPTKTGITREMLNNNPGLVLQPTNTMAADLIRWLPIPPLPADFYNVLNMLIGFFDRIYQIEDADRGVAPKGVVAASAIVALQERNMVMMQHKIGAVDFLVERRGQSAVSLYQNFGTYLEVIEVDGEPKPFVGNFLAGRQFNYVVESGSTTPRTSLQLIDDAKNLYQLGAIDRQALLEAVNFPNWQAILERVGEGQLGQAMQILVQAGLPEEVAQALYQQLMQKQGGPGNVPQQNVARAGVPGRPAQAPPAPQAVQQNPAVPPGA